MSSPGNSPFPSLEPTRLAGLQIPKLMDWPGLMIWRRAMADQGRKAVLVNGCFDLLHAGHIHFLQQARLLGNELIVAINGDESVRSLKGPSRPIQSEWERTYALAALSCTSALFIFRQPRLAQEIKTLAPDVYAKAGDYSLETLDASERAALAEVGADIRFVSFLPAFSSTDLIRRIGRANVALDPAPCPIDPPQA